MANRGMINWVFHNAQGALEEGDVATLLNGNILKVKGDFVSATIEISGTEGAAATVYFEGTCVDDSTYYPVTAIKSDFTTTATSTTSIGSMWLVDLTGLINFRVRLAEEITGDITVKGRVTD